MAAQVTNKSTSISYLLNAGTSESGKSLTKTMSFSGIRANFDADKALALGTAMASVMLYPVKEVNSTVKNLIEAGA